MYARAALTAYFAALAAAATTNTNLQTTFPASSGTTNLAAVKTIAACATFDGGRSNGIAAISQAEGDNSDVVFLLQDGVMLSNVITGPSNGEDTATFKQTSGTSYVNGGGARNADDKVLQRNGGGTVAVQNFLSCGDCDTQYARKPTFSNIRVDRASVAVGVNGNEGDTTTISNSCILGSAICWLYEGNDDGDEPTKTASAPDGKVCATSSVKASGC
ncbi:polysaccharide lyase family 3 protein [Cenococcum geophilum 1.58]|uniref:polysaccharide lyase family 3 protein n=1 Tax=Cenococcum geophilum 1.58 TaxID=794803 RepID=UPI00358F6089|nr:polysaccharide lyase family 3 protein [Cenococcum geophilum 1.58]